MVDLIPMVAQPGTIRHAIATIEAGLARPRPALRTALRTAHGEATAAEVYAQWVSEEKLRLLALNRVLFTGRPSPVRGLK